ncbi:MAG TPA: SBBP repeat-containing protein, partial [Candidatus Saccharimonadales bacterium]|nr:SBBP repeat-containing protein [Candidatus Saccharimonadales bacterium]
MILYGNYLLCFALAFGPWLASAQLAPTITTQPTSQTNFMDDDAVLQSAASGVSPLRYQWYFNGAALGEATNAVLSLHAVQPTNGGSYFLTVTNAFGSATSTQVVLTVKSVPQFAFVSQISGSGNDKGNGIAVDEAGNIYVTGSFSNQLALGTTNLASAGGTDAVLAKYNRAGQVLWAKRVGGPGNDSGTGVAVDPFGFIYFSGSVTGLVSFDGVAWTNSLGTSGYMAKYDSSGALQWVRTNPPTSHLSFDKGGNSYLANLGPLFLDKYDTNGNLIYRRWATHTPSQAGQPLPTGRGVTVDGA